MREVTIFFATVLVLYFASRHTINEIFYFFYCLMGNKKISFWLISIIFFPGTLIHELSHFFLAMMVFLPVVGLDIFPKFEGQSIKLGSVHYVKKDFFRGFIVGIAPFFGAILFFWLISHLPMNLFSYYLIFVVSSTMFSSKKDLEDLLYLIPLTLIIAAIFYVFNVSPIPFLDQLMINKTLIKFIDTINHSLFISLMINLLIFAILRLMRLLIRSFFKIC